MPDPIAASDLQRRWAPTLGQGADWNQVDPGKTQQSVEVGGTLSGLATISEALSAQGTLSGGGKTLAGGATVSSSGTQAAPGSNGGYDLVSELGRGGMGVVWRARQKSLARDIALKFIRPEVASGGARERFISEALVNGLLDHPNIVPVHELGANAQGDIYLAMKLVGGRSWKALLHPENDRDRAAANACDLDRHISILQGVGNAVAFAHARGIVHRDLKPENVMVGEFGEVLVMDWGIAVDIRDTPDGDQRAQHKSTVTAPSGTPSYMAPELAEGRGSQIGPWTDVYLLGAILHEVLTGVPPHRGRSLMEVLLASAASVPPQYAASVPAGLAAIAAKAMARECAERHQTVAEFQAALVAYAKNRDSERIASAARARLAGLGSDATNEAARVRLYAGYAEAVAGFRQALVLWDGNVHARADEREARVAYARAALAGGDFGLAEAQLDGLGEDRDGKPLHDQIAAARRAAEAAKRAAKRNRGLLVGAVGLIIVGLGVGFTLVNNEKRAAVAARDDAVQQKARAETNEQEAKSQQARAETNEREAAAQRDRALAAQREAKRQLAITALSIRDSQDAQGAVGSGLLWSVRAADEIAEDAGLLNDCRLGLVIREQGLPEPLLARAVTGSTKIIGVSAGHGFSSVTKPVPHVREAWPLGSGRVVALGIIEAQSDGNGPPALGVVDAARPGPLVMRPCTPYTDAVAAVDPQRRRAVVLEPSTDNEAPRLRIFSYSDGSEVVLLRERTLAKREGDRAAIPPASGSTSEVRFSGDGSRIIITAGGNVVVVEVDKLTVVGELAMQDDMVTAFSEAGRPWVAAWAPGQKIIYWNGRSGQEPDRIAIPSETDASADDVIIAPSPNDERLVVRVGEQWWLSRNPRGVWSKPTPIAGLVIEAPLAPPGERATWWAERDELIVQLAQGEAIQMGVDASADGNLLGSSYAKRRTALPATVLGASRWPRQQAAAARFAAVLHDRANLGADAVEVRAVGEYIASWSDDGVVLWDARKRPVTAPLVVGWQVEGAWQGVTGSAPWRFDELTNALFRLNLGDGTEQAIELPKGDWSLPEAYDRWLTMNDKDGRMVVVDLLLGTARVITVPGKEGGSARIDRAVPADDGRHVLALRSTVGDAANAYRAWLIDLQPAEPVIAEPRLLPLTGEYFGENLSGDLRRVATGLVLEPGGARLWVATGLRSWTALDLTGSDESRVERLPALGGARRWQWHDLIVANATSAGGVRQLLAQAVSYDDQLAGITTAVEVVVLGDQRLPLLPLLPMPHGGMADLSPDGGRFLIAAPAKLSDDGMLIVDQANPAAVIAARTRGVLLGSLATGRLIGDLPYASIPAAGLAAGEPPVAVRFLDHDHLLVVAGRGEVLKIARLELSVAGAELAVLRSLAVLATGRHITSAGEISPASGALLEQAQADWLQARPKP